MSQGAGDLRAIETDSIDALRFENGVHDGLAMVRSAPDAARRKLGTALEMWKGPAMAEFTYAPFAAPYINRLEDLRVAATEGMIEAEVEAGGGIEVAPQLESLIERYPLRERAYALLMTVLYRAGRQADALRVYRRAEARLAEELGLSPGSELRGLEEAILVQDPALDRLAPATATSPSGGAEVDLVGRTREIAFFHQAMQQAFGGRGSLLLVEGEPGAGKTALLEAMHARAREAGIPAALARCVEIGSTPPFWPWVQLSRSLMGILGVDRVTASAGPHAALLAPFFPDLAPDPARARAMPTALPPHRVAQGIIASMRRLTGDVPLVLLIDDVYGADPDSIAVLTLLASEIDTMGLVLVASLRPLSASSAPTLAEAVLQMRRFPATAAIEVPPFTAEETAVLVARLTTRPSTEMVEAIHQKSDGNPLFVTELARLVDQESGSLDGADLPASLREVIRHRLAGVDEVTLQMLRTASVCGRAWDLSMVAEVLEVAPFDLADSIDQATSYGLVGPGRRPGEWRFSHVLVAQALAQSLGSLRKADTHRRIRQLMVERFGDQPERWVTIAHHAVESVPMEGLEPAIEALSRAGRHALGSNAYQSAEILLAQRLELARSLPGTAARNRAEIDALLDLSRVWTWRHGYHSEQLGEAADRIMDLIGTGTTYDSEVLAEVVLPAFQARVSASIVAGRTDETARVVDRLDELAGDFADDLTRFSADMNRVVVAVHQASVPEAIEAAQRAETRLDALDPGRTGRVMLPLGQQSLVVTHHAFSAWAYWLAGEPDTARDLIRRMRVAALGSEHAFSRSFAAVLEGLVGSMDDDPDWVAEAALWGTDRHDEIEFGLNDVWLELLGTWAGARRTDPGSGVLRLGELVDRLEEMGALVTMTLYRSLLADLLIRAGAVEAALEQLAAAIICSAAHGERFWYPELERRSALLLAASGRREEAALALGRAREESVRMGTIALTRRIDATHL